MKLSISRKAQFSKLIGIIFLVIVIIVVVGFLFNPFFSFTEENTEDILSGLGILTDDRVEEVRFFYRDSFNSDDVVYARTRGDSLEFLSRSSSGETTRLSVNTAEFNSEQCQDSQVQSRVSGSRAAAQLIYEQDQEAINNFLQRHPGLELNTFLAILVVEGRGVAFERNAQDTHPRAEGRAPPLTRLECHHFNKFMNRYTIPCTCSFPEPRCNGQGQNVYSTIASETNFDAFLRAREIHFERAILSSSFGLGQVLGSNYEQVGYSSAEQYYFDMFARERQFYVYLRSLESRGIVRYMIEKDFLQVALRYNGSRCCGDEVPVHQRYNVLMECTYQNLNNQNNLVS